MAAVPGRGISRSLDQPSRNAYHINHYQHLGWSRQLSPEQELRIQFYHNYQKKDDHFGADLPPAVVAGCGFDSHRYDAELEYTNHFNENFRLATGFGGRYENGEGVWTLGENTLHADSYASSPTPSGRYSQTPL